MLRLGRFFPCSSFLWRFIHPINILRAMQEKLKQQVLDAFLLVMRPIVRILLRYGIGYREFVEVAKTAYVSVASSDFGLRGRPTNISRVAVMTGLTRKEVKRIRDKIASGDNSISVKTTPLADVLHHWHAQSSYTDSSGVPTRLPFTGGFVGYFGYDLIRSVERLPPKPRDPFGLPVAILARFDRVIVFDHAQQRVIAVANEIEGECTAEQADLALDELEQMLNSEMHVGASRVEIGSTLAAAEADSSLDGADYRAAVERAQEYIRRGDIFQVVLARRFSLRRSIGALDLYRALRRINPSPYMVLLESPEASLVGASPEMLVRKTGSRVEARPIAGTRPRGESTEEDERLAESLLQDEKERAEHVMLVDLGRNDLGRVAKVGSIELPQFMEIERYSHVMHIVSSVAGECLDSSSSLDVLLACFPAGTVSGAPKIRAMEIIDELEPESRGPYAGAVGYISFTGDLDTCITIRTLVVKDGEVSVTAGAGIVADSVPATEERETESKAAALLAAVDLAEMLGG